MQSTVRVCGGSSVILLDVVQHKVKSSGLLTIVSHSDGGAASDLAGDSLLVILALAEPLTELRSLFDFEEGDVVGFAQGLHIMFRIMGVMLTVISFLYLASSQSSARTHRRASLRSRALQTSFNPFTRPMYIHDHERFVCKIRKVNALSEYPCHLNAHTLVFTLCKHSG